MTHFTSDGDKTKQAQELIESLLLSKYGKSSGKYGRIDEDSIERWDEGG